MLKSEEIVFETDLAFALRLSNLAVLGCQPQLYSMEVQRKMFPNLYVFIFQHVLYSNEALVFQCCQ